MSLTIQEIERLHQTLDSQSLYALLEVATDASTDAIHKAYLEKAKLWHTDRLTKLQLSAAQTQQAEVIFRRMTEAKDILSEPKRRQTYDWECNQKAKGLPTDTQAIFEAESLFHRAEGLVRRGQAASALPLLQQATTLNQGEAEYWAYLGYALFLCHGSSQEAQAKAYLEKSRHLNANLDVTYEFLGRIEHAMHQASAKQHLEKAMALNPKNVHAIRELRLLQMRLVNAEAPPAGAAAASWQAKLNMLWKKMFKKK